MKKKQNTGFIKNINSIWVYMAIGFALMAIVAFYLDERISEKYSLTDPIQTEAILIDTYCATREFAVGQSPYLGIKYQYFVHNEMSKKSLPYQATNVLYLMKRDDCEKKSLLAKSTMQKVSVWYERSEPTKVKFSLEKDNTLQNAKISLSLAIISLLIGIFWAWAMQKK